MQLVLAGLALVVAGIQFNDPDPIYWIFVYTATAVVLAAGAFNRHSSFWTAVLMGAITAGMLWTLAGLGTYLLAGDYASIFGSMSPDRPYVEETREFLGLAMAMAAVVWVYRRQPAAHRQA